MRIPVNGVGDLGIIVDRQPHELPFNAWTAGQNVRFRDGYAEKFNGHSVSIASPAIAPYFLMPVEVGAAYWWIFAGLAAVYANDGTNNFNITRSVGGAYGATELNNWTGGVLGGLPILNDAVDPPQLWSPVSGGQVLVALTNWPANTTCKSLRPFRTYLVALNVTKSGVNYPQMVKWSSSAPAGNVPVTWDPADATNDAGEYNLMETTDFVVDSFPLRNALVIYKESNTWLMQYIGGAPVFSFNRIFTGGILSRRCAVEFANGQHAVFSDGDVVIHDGQTPISIVNSKVRSFIFNNIDPTNQAKSFVVHNKPFFEVLFCYPQIGSNLPNIAGVWNYKFDEFGFRDLNQVAHIELGIVNPGSDAWNAAVGIWGTDTRAWGDPSYNPAKKQLQIAQPSPAKIYLFDDTTQFDGVNMTSFIERTGLGFPIVDSNGPPDFEHQKVLTNVWPRITGTLGGVVNVYVGSQNAIGVAPTYQGPFPFTIGTTNKIDVVADAKLHALKFQSVGDLSWKLHGYEVDAVPSGNY